MPYPDQSFDLVVSWLMLHHTTTWERALAEAHRVLRPGGTLLGYDLLDTVPARVIHRIDRSEDRQFASDELTQVLRTAFESTHLKLTFAVLACRRAATRTADTGVDRTIRSDPLGIPAVDRTGSSQR